MSVCLWLPRLLPGVGVCFVLVGTTERLPTWTTGDEWSRAIHESSVESVWHVDRDSPIGCTSIQIASTLGYEYHLFDAVITWIT
jgi:hypothetical protein